MPEVVVAMSVAVEVPNFDSMAEYDAAGDAVRVVIEDAVRGEFGSAVIRRLQPTQVLDQEAWL